jgi:uncharacterized protein
MEVLAAFVFVHVTWRSLKHFTVLGRWEGESGLNFLPGLVMILFTVSVLFLCGRNFTAYGLTMNQWRQNLNIGLFWSCALAGLAGLGLLVTRVHFDPSHPHNNLASRLTGAVFGVAMTVFMLWTFQKRKRDAAGIFPILSVLALVVLLSIPLIVTAWHHQLILHATWTVGWLFLGAGFGEETFYRGYIQSRVDEAFGKPFQLLRLNFGLGLCVSSQLFGFLHALNTVDYFQGHYNFAWWYGVQSCFVGLFYGCLREKTGSLLAGGVTHGLTDVLAGVPAMISSA